MLKSPISAMIIESIRKLIPENVVIGESILFIMDWMAASISEISLLNSSMSLMVCLSSNLKTYLLNNFMIFNIGEHSNCLISSVKPLNVDEDVVDIDYESDAGWYIWFKSNYYDHVVFEITAENGNKYYIRIDRVTFGIADTFGQNQNKPQVVANFYYPSDYSYEEFDVLATKVKKDGSEEIFIVNASEGIDLITGDSMQNDTSGGENLKKSEYLVDVDDTTAGVYFAVVYKGALNGEKEVYDGTFSGSGKGVYYDITSRQTRYDV